MLKSKKNIIQLILIVSFLVVWQSIIYIFPYWGDILSSPFDIIYKFKEAEANNDLIINTLSSIRLFTISVLLSIIIGILLAFISYKFQYFYMLIQPLIYIKNSVPIIAFIPIFIIWFGFGEFSKIITIVVISLPSIFISTLEGLKNINKDIFYFSRNFEIKGSNFYYNILLQAIIPYLLSGIRISLGRAIIGLTLAEMFGFGKGIGYMLNYYNTNFDITGVMMIICILLFINFVFLFFLDTIKKIFFKGYNLGVDQK